MPGTISRFGLGTSISVIIVRVSSFTFSRETRDGARERLAAQRFHAHVHLVPQMDVFDVLHGHGEIQPQAVVVGDPHQRHGLGIGRRARLDERAGVGIAPGDHAVERGGDLRVGEQRLISLHVRFGGGDGGRGRAVLGFGGIEVLLGDEIGMLLVDRRKAGVDEMGVGVIGLGLLLRGHRVVEFVLQFRDFQCGQELAGLHPVAEVHVHLVDVTGNLGVQLHFYIRPELRGDGHLVVKVLAGHSRDGDRRRRGRPESPAVLREWQSRAK